MDEQKPKTKCDFCQITKDKGFLSFLSTTLKKTCGITGTNIPDEHQAYYCYGNFFQCRFFEEYLKSVPKPKTMRIIK